MGLITRHQESPLIATGQQALAVPTQSAHPPMRSRRVSPLREGPRVHTRGLYFGTAADGEPVYLHPRHLRTHLHVLGATGTGKSKLLLWLFQLLSFTNRPIILADFKGGLFKSVRDWALTNGLTKRLMLFDLNATTVLGYNPLRESSLRLDLQAQWVSEGIKSAWGQATFDATPQLARYLYLVLFVSRALKLSLVEGLDVLRPYPGLRERALMRITDPFVHSALRGFHNLNDRRKEEVAASTLARLEAFCRDRTIQTIICSPQSLDLEAALTERKILLLNLAKNQPLLADPLKLLARMFMSDLLAHMFRGYGEGKFSEDKPVYFIVDEVQNMATRQLCDALDEGRGIGLHCIISHQHMHQLADEDQSGYLYHSVMTDARAKILTGGLGPEDLKVFSDYLLMDHYDPWRIKHIQRTPSYRPVESVREVPTYGTSHAHSHSTTENYTEADSMSHSAQHSSSRGRSLADAVAFTEGEQESYTYGRNSSSTESHNWGTSESINGSRTRSQAHTDASAVGHARGHGRSASDGTTDSYGTHSASGWSRGNGTNSATNSGEGRNMLPPEEGLIFTEDPEVIGLSAHTGTSDGTSSFAGTSGMSGSNVGHARSRMQATSDTEVSNTSVSAADMSGFSISEGWASARNEGHGLAETQGENEAWTIGTNRSMTRGNTVTNSEQVTDGYTDTVGKTFSRGVGFTDGETTTRSESVTLSPFYQYVREEIETPTFLTPEEQRLLVMQKLARIRTMYPLVKVPTSSDRIVCAPYVPEPTITERRRAAGLNTVYTSDPGYTTLAQDDRENIAAQRAGNVARHGDDDVVDVEVVREVSDAREQEHVNALPSPAPEDATIDPEAEAALWASWTTRSRSYNGRQEK